jgi:glycosyltransferase involved in cell wall biosynthesis
VAVADTPVSFAAVARHPRSVVTVHYSARLDLKSVPPRSPARFQDVRTEKRAVHEAALTIAYSASVARALRRPAVVAPIAYPVPAEPLEQPDAPVAACIADWIWPPNAWALRLLLDCWPLVRERLPAASLLLAGPGLAAGHPGQGVTALGPVGSSAEILGRAKVMVFPCPPTTGPKMKVLEALASGRAVVTTAPGLDGLWLDGDSGAVTAVSDARAIAVAAAELLADSERCAQLGRMGRRSIAGHHAPRPAARARIEAWSRLT